MISDRASDADPSPRHWLTRNLRRIERVAWWTLTLQLPSRLRERRHAIERQHQTELLDDPRRSYKEWIKRFDTIEEQDLPLLQTWSRSLEHRPLISILLPVFNTPERFLREAIESVLSQVYERWELCIADDASTDERVGTIVAEYSRRDSRIRVTRRAENGGISAASNSALELAQGDFVGLLDHDDVLRPHALLLVTHALNSRPDVSYVYSDEDHVDVEGERSSPYFKPDWNPALLLSQNFLGHFSVFAAELARRVGGFRSAYDGSQDWDLALRLTRQLPDSAIRHVPHVLYHWRAAPGSVALRTDEKPYAIEAAGHAIEDHLAHVGATATATAVDGAHHSVRYRLPSPGPLVSAIVPTTASPDLVELCARGLLERTSYDSLEVLLVVGEQDSASPEKRLLLDRLSGTDRLRVLVYPERPFEYAWTNNWAAEQARGDLLLFLNDDVDVIHEDWLEIMAGQALQVDVGAVGALLLYPDETIQHAGVLLGAGTVADHLYRGRPAGTAGYVNRAKLTQDVSAVTGACMLVRREAFDAVAGFDESLAVAFNDVDLCLRLRGADWRVVYTPDARLWHREAATFGWHSRGRGEEYRREVELMRERWRDVLADDPMHNPNLALDAAHPERLAFPPRVSYPWQG